MKSVLNVVALVIFAASLFGRSVDPVIPQIAASLAVPTATAALLSTAYALPFAVIQPVLGVIADSFGKIRLMMISLLLVALATLVGALATNFYFLVGARVLAGLAAGGLFPVGLAIAGDLVPLAQRQVAIGRLLAAGMSGNLLGASAAGITGDLLGWRGVFFGTGGLGLIVFVIAIFGFRGVETGTSGRFDVAALGPNFRAIFRHPMGKFCFGAVFFEGVFVFGILPYMATLLLSGGETRLAIAGVVIAGFGVGGIAYTLAIARLLPLLGERRLMATGGTVMGLSLVSIALRAAWQIEFLDFVLLGFGFYMLHGCIQIHVTELAPHARATAMSLHSAFFFLGQAVGPIAYGFGLTYIGASQTLIASAIGVSAVGWVCSRFLRHALPPAAARG